MCYKTSKLLLLVFATMLLVNPSAKSAAKAKSPLDELPPWIKQATHFGQRADFSHDGKRLLFIEKTFGDIYEVELKTNSIRPMTHHYFHEGYTRALYLANGDILLSGARQFDATNPWPSRKEKNAELWVLKKDLSSPPTPLGEKCKEGPAVSRSRMRIAWTLGKAIYMADIIYENGTPKLANKNRIMDERNLPFKCGIETQNFRPPADKELIFTAYGIVDPNSTSRDTEVMGLDIETGKVVNYSLAPKQYDEPEGIFPDGKYTLVECNRHNPTVSSRPDSKKGPGARRAIDVYKLALNGSGEIERLIFFADYPGYKSSNPVVSDDGQYMAFQYAALSDPAGVGRGILIFDLAMYEKMKKAQGQLP